MSIGTLAARQQKLIRKAQDAAIFAAPESADPITAITTGSGGDLITLPTAWRSLGHHTESDGINWTRDVSSDDVRSHGSSEPTRRDISSDVTGLVVLAQETKLLSLEMFHNVDLTAITPDSTTHEVAFNRSRVPSTRYWRLLAVASDGAGEDTIYFARFCPRAAISDYAEQPWTKGDELRYPLTFTAFVDDDLGYAMREMWGGPGIASLLADMGFANEVQNVTVTGAPTGGTFTLTFDGQTTGTIAYNATGSTVQTALEALSNIAPGDVSVTGSAGGPYAVTFSGAYAGVNVPAMTANGSGLTGGTSPSVTVS
ncbi:hypothetical protein [Amycolatopsis sp. NPDC021455]|uniref:phage tail tube protein n=1 Tax=Amycolatopsis sp. NPDC021455 TaxID=3154901 RepID=UPI0033C05479